MTVLAGTREGDKPIKNDEIALLKRLRDGGAISAEDLTHKELRILRRLTQQGYVSMSLIEEADNPVEKTGVKMPSTRDNP